jgi:hypothetical protein
VASLESIIGMKIALLYIEDASPIPNNPPEKSSLLLDLVALPVP